MATCRRRRVSNAGSDEERLVYEDDEDNSLQPAGHERNGEEEEQEEEAGPVEDLGWSKDAAVGFRRPRSVRIATGVLDTISQKYESLDYEVNFNSLMLDEIRKRGWKFVLAKVSARKES